MSWTDERIDTLKTMWEKGLTASQIAESLGGVSRNAVIGKAHRLGLQARPSPVKANDPEAKAAAAPKPVAAAPVASPAPKPVAAPRAAPVVAAPTAEPDIAKDLESADLVDDLPAVEKAPAVIMRSVGPGGFLRQAPGEQQAPITPAPPRRLVPARPSADMAGKTTLLDLNDRICKWPLGHPGEPDFHFCGEKVNPGFPYCIAHCGHAYQAQLPRRDRRPPPPLPFGGPRVR
jgi:GcrA cell cycle regulator